MRGKKYTKDHEWIELSPDGKTGTLRHFQSLPLLHSSPAYLLPKLPFSGTYPHANQGTIGISIYAAQALGDVVFIELPTVGTKVGAGDTIGAVESVKSASDILAPQAGTVVAKNDLLEEKPGVINTSPEQDGWIAKIEVESDGKDVEGLMGLEEYRKLTEE